jgi:hypothetical protein
MAAGKKAAKKRSAAKRQPSRKGPEGGRNSGQIQSGEVRNPEGRNQYSYRRDFEAIVTRMYRRSKSKFLKSAMRDLLPESVHDLYDDLYDQTLGDSPTIGEVQGFMVVLNGLVGGDQRHVSDLLKRLWPAEATGTEDDPIHASVNTPDLSGETKESLRDALKRLGG